jgi:isocitrate dehydrogenase (NAD+)
MEAISSSLLREFILAKLRVRSAQTLVVLEGDQTGQELLLEALRVLDPSVTGVELTFEQFDLSLSNRRATANRVVLDAAAAIKRRHLGLKAATITPEGQGDVGSPNRILREAIGGSVIVRTGRKLPRVRPVGGIHAPISVVRMAVGDAYGAKEWREGEGMDEVAFRTEQISRRVCRYVSEYAFVHASKMGATVFGGPKFTVSPVYEGMLKEEMDAAAAASQHSVRSAAHRRHVCAAALRRGRQAAGDSIAQSRRRLPLGSRNAAVRLDCRRRIDFARF